MSTRRGPGLLLPALVAVLTAGAWWSVDRLVRAAHEGEVAGKIGGRLGALDGALERTAEEVAGRLERLERLLLRPESERTTATLLDGKAAAVDEAAWLGAVAGLELLTLLDERGLVVSSRHWPEQAGLRDPALDGIAIGRGSLRRIRDVSGSRLAVLLRRDLELGARRLSLIGGIPLDLRFLRDLADREPAWIFDFEADGGRAIAANDETRTDLSEWSALARLPNARAGEVVVVGSSPGETWSAGRRVLTDDGGASLGAVVVATSHGAIETLRERLRAVFLVVGGVGMAGSLAGGLLLRRKLARPGERLVRAVDAIAAGEADYTFPHEPGEELDRLAQAFSRMQRDLERQHRRSVAAERVAAWREAARRVAHEVKNPLAPIRLTVENLLRARRQDPALFDELFEDGSRTILEEVEQLRRLVTEFSEFARLPESRPQPVDLHRLLDAALELHAAVPQLVIERNYAAQAAEVEVDPDQIGRVLKNVIGNAVEATRAASSRRVLRVRSAIDADSVQIEIADNGPGFAEDQLGRVFEPYFTTKKEGTGLGLAIAHRIVTEHAGSLEARNGSHGGASVLIRLPLRAKRTQRHEART